MLGLEIMPPENWSSELSKDLTQGHRVKQQGGKKVKVLVPQSCLRLCNPMECRPPGTSVLEILQTILEWAASSSSRESSRSRDWTRVSCIAGRFFTNWAMREALLKLQTELPSSQMPDIVKVLCIWNLFSCGKGQFYFCWSIFHERAILSEIRYSRFH